MLLDFYLILYVILSFSPESAVFNLYSVFTAATEMRLDVEIFADDASSVLTKLTLECTKLEVLFSRETMMSFDIAWITRRTAAYQVCVRSIAFKRDRSCRIARHSVCAVSHAVKITNHADRYPTRHMRLTEPYRRQCSTRPSYQSNIFVTGDYISPIANRARLHEVLCDHHNRHANVALWALWVRASLPNACHNTLDMSGKWVLVRSQPYFTL